MDATTDQLNKLQSSADKLKYKIDEAQKLIPIKNQQINEFNAIVDGYSSWENNCTNVKNIQSKIDKALSELQSYDVAIDRLKASIKIKEKDLNKLEIEYESHISNQHKLTRLLDEIETHVENSICPFNTASKWYHL